MKLALPATLGLSLMLSLPAALGKITLAQELTLVVATDWSDGHLDMLDPEYKSFDIKTLYHEIKVDDKTVWDVYEWPITEALIEPQGRFKVQRTSWDVEEGTTCDVIVLADPKVPIVHIMLDGKGDMGDIRVNKFEEYVKLNCTGV